VVDVVSGPPNNTVNRWYAGNRAPLLKESYEKLPVTAFRPGGWLKKQLELQRDGLTGHLGEISVWLSKKDNAWLTKDGKGKYGWEELPYWLKGYANLGYMLRDPAIIREALFWINSVLANQRENGDFGPMVERNGNRDLWTNMPMLWCLKSYYEYSLEGRVLKSRSRYFRWSCRYLMNISWRITGRRAGVGIICSVSIGCITGQARHGYWTLPRRSTVIRLTGGRRTICPTGIM